MANTYTQIHIHSVFAVQHRMALIQNGWEDELFKYITGIIQSYDHKVLAINGMPDHVHIFFGMRPNQSLSDLMKEVKQSSSKWINDRRLLKTRFEWQQGYGAFSYNRSRVSNVITYIQNQKTHHQRKSFIDEYKGLLKEFSIEHDERYIFKELE